MDSCWTCELCGDWLGVLPPCLTVLCCAVTGSACLVDQQLPPHLPQPPLQPPLHPPPQQQSGHHLQLQSTHPHLQVSIFVAAVIFIGHHSHIQQKPGGGHWFARFDVQHTLCISLVQMSPQPANHNANPLCPTGAFVPESAEWSCVVLCIALPCWASPCPALPCPALCCTNANAHLCQCSHHGAFHPLPYLQAPRHTLPYLQAPLHPLNREALQLAARWQLPHHCQ